MNNCFISTLERRGLLANVTASSAKIALFLKSKESAGYIGFDPTASSLHVGSLLQVVTLRRLQLCGHRPIALVGGATGLIGDPSGRASERPFMDRQALHRNVQGIEECLRLVIDFSEGSHGGKLINNHSFYENMNALTFLRDVGKNFRVNAMMTKDSVKSRLDSEEGMSFTEFSYQLLQSYDFQKLFEEEECALQIGGTDQWGNITAGTHLIHKLHGENVHAYGVTLPLITDSAGKKIGKSSDNAAIWLHPEMTSDYDFYQYFVRSDDEDACRFLRYFTFLPLEKLGLKIEEVEKEHKKAPHLRLAQKTLAEEVTKLVRGDDGLARALSASQAMFSKDVSLEEMIDGPLDSAPLVEMSRAALLTMDMASLITDAGIAGSKSQARRLISGGGLYVNKHRVDDMKAVLKEEDLIKEQFVLLQSGKRQRVLVKAV